jgi:hypothetical protein
MKWVMLVIVGAIGYMVATGNMGGAKSATGNYVQVRGQGAASDDSVEARPSALHQMIEYTKNH